MTPQFCKSLFQRAQKSNFSAMGKSFLYFLVVLMHIGLTAQEEKLDYNEVKDIENFGKFRYVQVIGSFWFSFLFRTRSRRCSYLRLWCFGG